ncbi:crossover junction endodeoxyribonuclease RuvC [Orientia chuto str. Dubai]|uniref:Crossover junction endodeoxyribonuclease RuvC n=1 Tax=Orientia chuto str. Dubai TaxID=1359168 RepID=A0A0F3MJT0_9RICK|nr:crossover junction endodeoxyribonuclease RuvC [Candidatus Orientia mediorientalis]KJV56005.1 crossover junction endodeoxyribonuclease RuvC [Orientia chuto str. Dubai]
MIILGIDPSLTSTGWGIIDVLGSTVNYINSGVIKTISKDSLILKLGQISFEVEKLITYFNPYHIAMEEVFINKNYSSSVTLIQARGAIMSVIGRYNIDFSEYAPNKIKKAIVGAGKAEKHQVQQMVKLLMNIKNVINKDESDALATAYTASVNRKII